MSAQRSWENAAIAKHNSRSAAFYQTLNLHICPNNFAWQKG